MVQIKVKKVHPDAIIPDYAHQGDAGMDVYSVEDVVVYPKEMKSIPTGLSFELPQGYEIQVRPKWMDEQLKRDPRGKYFAYIKRLQAERNRIGQPYWRTVSQLERILRVKA